MPIAAAQGLAIGLFDFLKSRGLAPVLSDEGGEAFEEELAFLLRRSREHTPNGHFKGDGLVRRSASQQVLKAALADPSGAGQMALPDAFSPQRLFIRIELQDDLRDLLPIDAVVLGVQQTQIRDEVLFIVPGQHWFGRSQIGNRRIDRWLLHIATIWVAVTFATPQQQKRAVNRDLPRYPTCACIAARPHAAACCYC